VLGGVERDCEWKPDVAEPDDSDSRGALLHFVLRFYSNPID
jgi:hypothetical protein